jgi:hypothetical protein
MIYCFGVGFGIDMAIIAIKKKVGKEEKGGCYAASGPVAIQWHNTRKNGAANDAAALREFVRTLPHGSFLRHHIAGDCGRELGAP